MPSEALITIATRHQSHFERLKAAEVKKFDDFLKRMDVYLRQQLGSQNLTDFSRVRIEDQIRQISAILNGVYSDYKRVWMDGMTKAATYEAGFEARALGQVVSGVSFSMPSDSQIAAAVFNTPLGDIGGAGGGALLESFFDGMSQSQINRVGGVIRLGYAQGETTQQIIQRIRGTAASGYTDGVWGESYRNVEAVTRTALQHAATQARAETWQTNKSVIKGEQVVATLDRRTSPTCRSLDGEIFPLGKGPRPPFHIRCRSSMVAVLADKYAGLSRGRTRAERDPTTGEVGKVSADTTYYGWLKTQPASVQDSIIGPARGALLRNGGLSSDRFAELQLGKLNNPLTLDQMRELEPAAFEKAGL